MSYELIEDKTDDSHFAVHITAGNYSDVVYRYNHIKVTESDDDYATLKFNWNIIEGDITLEDDPEFEHMIGQILEEVMIEAIDFKFADKGKSE